MAGLGFLVISGLMHPEQLASLPGLHIIDGPGVWALCCVICVYILYRRPLFECRAPASTRPSVQAILRQGVAFSCYLWFGVWIALTPILFAMPVSSGLQLWLMTLALVLATGAQSIGLLFEDRRSHNRVTAIPLIVASAAAALSLVASHFFFESGTAAAFDLTTGPERFRTYRGLGLAILFFSLGGVLLIRDRQQHATA